MVRHQPGGNSDPSLRVAMETSGLNPYTTLLAAHLSRLGLRVCSLARRQLLSNPPDVVHIHWPERFARRGRVVGLVRLATFLLPLTLARAQGAAIVWTAHNEQPHEQGGPTQRAALRWVGTHADGLISLSRAGEQAILSRYPGMKDIPRTVVSHGHFRDVYATGMTREEARARLGVDARERIALYFGNMRAYKGVPELVSAFKCLEADGWRLFAVGAPHTPDVAHDVRKSASRDQRVTLVLEWVDDQTLEAYVRAADLVVLPYRAILHSGAAVLALSLGQPVLLPALGSLPELRDEVGPAWVRLYEPPLTSGDLQDAIRWAMTSDREDVPDLRAWDWTTIAQETVGLYARSRVHRQRLRSRQDR